MQATMPGFGLARQSELISHLDQMQHILRMNISGDHVGVENMAAPCTES